MQLNAAKLKEGLEQFHEPRREGEMDLVLLIRDLLISKGLEDRVLIAYDSDPLIKEASDKRAHVQRFILNRYWVRQMACCPENTMNIRLYLINSGTEEQWYQIFVQYVLDFVIQNGLPKLN